MLNYMERKYGESFTSPEPYAGQAGKDYAMLRVRSADGKAEEILVRAVREGKITIYQDNYLAYRLKDSIEQRMKELVSPIYGKCRVFYKIPELVFPTDFSPDMDADAFLRHPQSQARVYFYIEKCPADPQKQFQQLQSVLKEKEYIIGGIISYPANEKMYQMITTENFTRDLYLGYQYKLEGLFSMDEKGGLIYLEWKEGDLHRR